MKAEELIQHFPDQPIPEIIEKLFRKHVNRRFVDFKVVAHDETLLKGYVPDAVHKQFIVIGAHGTGSSIAIWKEKELPADQLPLVWIDSESEPISVFANNFREFLTLLPYDFGFILDVILKWETPSSDPQKEFTPEMLQKVLEENRVYHSSLPEYESWLHDEIGLKTAPDPVKIIGDAIRNHPGLSELLKK